VPDDPCADGEDGLGDEGADAEFNWTGSVSDEEGKMAGHTANGSIDALTFFWTHDRELVCGHNERTVSDTCRDNPRYNTINVSAKTGYLNAC